MSVGLLLVPFAATFGVLSLQAGARPSARFGARTTITVGLADERGGDGTRLAFVVARRSRAGPSSRRCSLGAGLSLLIAPPSTVMMNGLPAEKAGDGSSFSMVSRFVGASVGVAIVGSVFAAAYTANVPGGSGPPPTDGVLGPAARTAFADAAAAGYLVIAGLAAIAAVVAGAHCAARSPPPACDGLPSVRARL